MTSTERFVESGRVLARVSDYVTRLPVGGAKVLEICEMVEAKTRELGARPAFPCCVCVDEVAAHETGADEDPAVIPEHGLVKIDFGAQIDGYPTDTAVTVPLNPAYAAMVDTAEQALREALRAVAPGRRISEVGGVIERAIRSRGFAPVTDLTGHQIVRNRLHAGKVVPNSSKGAGKCVFEAGEVYAIEPFVTLPAATGRVRAAGAARIYSLGRAREKGGLSEDAASLAERIGAAYGELPFATRWIIRMPGGSDNRQALGELARARLLVSYPPLVEASGKPVAQAEHTVLVTADGCRILTARE